MAVEIPNNTPIVRLEPIQELKQTKAVTELYVGQILKTVVVKALSENQVLININGQNLNARTSHHVEPGELLQVKVLQTEGEAVLQILRTPLQTNPLQTALMQTLPKQAPPAYLLATLSGLGALPNLPATIQQQIQQLLASITPLTQLPQHLAQAISHSGIFWENSLLNWRRDNPKESLNLDFKGQCLRLLTMLNSQLPLSNTLRNPASYYESDTLSLPANFPQPQRSLLPLSFTDQPLEQVLAILREHTAHTLARIETNQLLHLLSAQEAPYSLMLDLPVNTLAGLEVIPLKLEDNRQKNAQASGWSISFAIHLTNLGDIQAKVSLQGSAIDIQLYAEKEETVEFLAASQQIFANLLQELNLSLNLWNVNLGLFSEEIDTSNLHLLDIRI
ncbi:flagellar hook-length control protein FliK [Legionella cardiaca]|uniref:Flagellar hook-length control protein FliK n=1 Tax=Legionella cardiaca TaxID=1071983 RepID=A0ABY8AUS5_9GAMM|nr:flagellar hook-length control protein FliK [Legionella cardiaca]WED43270.1 flagellar hook-length control protein FliK [Legionella cardiaca]